jgi:hypothetical protein
MNKQISLWTSSEDTDWRKAGKGREWTQEEVCCTMGIAVPHSLKIPLKGRRAMQQRRVAKGASWPVFVCVFVCVLYQREGREEDRQKKKDRRTKGRVRYKEKKRQWDWMERETKIRKEKEAEEKREVRRDTVYSVHVMCSEMKYAFGTYRRQWRRSLLCTAR